MNFTKKEILQEIDLAFQGIPSSRFPNVEEEDIKYNFFLDLEHGYCEIAYSRIHLYANEHNWAIVMESSGYHNRRFTAQIGLNYIGDCITYPINVSPERKYVSNTKIIDLITAEEFERIENKSGREMEQFELIDSEITQINIRDHLVEIDLDSSKYEELGILIRDFDNPHKLISFEDLIRYLAETQPDLISATEEEIKTQLPKDLSKLLVIDDFYHLSVYDKNHLPSQIETYKLISEILVEKDAKLWQPTLKSNNHWSNWESGHL